MRPANRKKRYAITLVLTTIIFVAGIFVGGSITQQRIDDINQKIQDELLNVEGLRLELELLQGSSKEVLCSHVKQRLPDILRAKTESGRLFESSSLPQKERQFIESQFTISIAQFFLFLDIQEKECDFNNPKILFFKDASESSREQGVILDNVVFNVGEENIVVLTFFGESRFREPLIDLFFQKFNVTSMPTIVVNNRKYEDLQTRDDVLEILCGTYQLRLCGL